MEHFIPDNEISQQDFEQAVALIYAHAPFEQASVRTPTWYGVRRMPDSNTIIDINVPTMPEMANNTDDDFFADASDELFVTFRTLLNEATDGIKVVKIESFSFYLSDNTTGYRENIEIYGPDGKQLKPQAFDTDTEEGINDFFQCYDLEVSAGNYSFTTERYNHLIANLSKLQTPSVE